MKKKTIITATTALLLSLSSAFAATPMQKKQFSDGDKDGDRALSKAEYVATRLAVFEASAKKNNRELNRAGVTKRLEGLFAEADKNSDGKLTEDEFYASFEKK